MSWQLPRPLRLVHVIVMSVCVTDDWHLQLRGDFLGVLSLGILCVSNSHASHHHPMSAEQLIPNTVQDLVINRTTWFKICETAGRWMPAVRMQSWAASAPGPSDTLLRTPRRIILGPPNGCSRGQEHHTEYASTEESPLTASCQLSRCPC